MKVIWNKIDSFFWTYLIYPDLPMVHIDNNDDNDNDNDNDNNDDNDNDDDNDNNNDDKDDTR